MRPMRSYGIVRQVYFVLTVGTFFLGAVNGFAGDDYDLETAAQERNVAQLELNRERSNLASAQSNLNSAVSQEAETRRRISEINVTIQRIETRIAELKASIKSDSRQIPVLQQEYQDDKAEEQRQRQLAQSIELNRVDPMERQLTSDIRPRIERLKLEIQNAERDSSDRTELVRLKKELASVQAQETRIRADIEAKKEQVASLKAESLSLKKQAVEKRKSATQDRVEAKRIADERAQIVAQHREPLRKEIVDTIVPRKTAVRDRIEVIKGDPAAAAELKALRAELVKLDAREKEARADIARLDRNEITPRTERIDTLKLQSDSKVKEAEAHTNRATLLDVEVDNIQNHQIVALVERIQNEITPKKQSLQTSISSLQIRVDAENRKIAELKQDLLELQRQEQAITSDIVRIRNNEIAPLRARADQLALTAERKKEQVQVLRSRIADSQSELRRLEDSLIASQDMKRQLEMNLPTLQERVRTCQSEVRSAEVRVSGAESTFNAKQSRYNQVKRNREIAEQQAKLLGADEGAKVGATQAGMIASQHGHDRGLAEGGETGLKKGKLESQKISYAKGFNLGLTSPESAPLSYQDGQLAGLRTLERHASVTAYPSEINKALEEISQRVPSVQTEVNLTDDLEVVEFDSGLFGFERQNVATVQSPVLPNNALEPEYSEPLPGEPDIREPEPTAVEAMSCSKAHPLFTQVCKESFVTSLKESFKLQYRMLFSTAYSRAFQESSKSAYSEARMVVAEAEVLRGTTDSSREVGVVHGYRKNEESVLAAAVAKAKLDIESGLEATSLIRLVQLSIQDANDDGVLSPGEQLSFTAVIDNLGLKPSRTHGLRMDFTQSLGIHASEISALLPSLSGDTRTTLRGVLPSVVKVADRSRVEATLELKYVDLEDRTKVLGSLSATAEVSFPVNITQMEIGSVAAVGGEGMLIFTVKNNTRKDFSAAKLNVGMSQEIGTTKDEGIATDLMAGASTQVKVPYVVGLSAGGNQSFPIKLTLSGLSQIDSIQQVYDAIIPAQRNASLFACLPDCKVNYRMPLKVKAGSEVSIPIILKVHSKQASTLTYEIRRTESSSAAIMPGDGSFLSTVVTNPAMSNIENRYEMKLRFPLSLKGQSHWMSAVLKESGKVIHRLYIPFVVE